MLRFFFFLPDISDGVCLKHSEHDWGGVSFYSNGKVTELAVNQWATPPWLDLDNVPSAAAQFLYQPVRRSRDSSSSLNTSHYF